ncbi:TPA: DUF3846 domain-containing protein [Enterococcus faecalis]|nr:DUF3846 domain-containing protein [Enterococcus faecalis]
MSHAIKIYVKDNKVVSRRIMWNDTNNLDTIQKSLGVDSADVQSLTNTIDVWVDDIGALKKGNYLIGMVINNQEYRFAGKVLLLGIDNDTGKTRGLSSKELEWIDKNLKLWAKPIGFIN